MKVLKRNTKYSSELNFQADHCNVSIIVSGRFRSFQRRTVLVSLFKLLKPGLKYWRDLEIRHDELDYGHMWRPLKRGIHLEGGCDLSTMDGKFGTWVRYRRQHLYLTQRELADRVSVTATTISLLERNLQKPRAKLKYELIRLLKPNAISK